MTIFRGPTQGTLPDGSVIATSSEIAEALTLAQQAQGAAEAAQAAAEARLDDFDDRYLGAKTSDPTVDNDGDPLIDGALYYNTTDVITRVYDVSEGTWSDLKPSANDQANINALGPVASQVETVGDNITDVQTVATDLSGTDTIGTVATDIANVNTTASSIADVNTVASDLNETTSDIEVVSTNITDVNTVSGISTDVSTVAGIDGDVTTVSGLSSNVTTVAGVSTDVTTVAGISSDVTTVAADGADIDTVSTNIGDVNTVAGISTDITTVVSFESEIVDVSQSSDAVDIIASDLAGAGFDYDLGTITAVTEGVLGTPNGYIISLFNIRDDIVTVAGIADDVVNFARTDQEVRDLFSAGGDITYNSSTGTFSFTERTDPQVRGLFSAAGDLSYNSTTGEFSVTTYKSSNFDTDFASKTTDDLTEGTSNFYYADSLVDSHLSGGTGVTYSTGNISIGQDVGTTADVTFNSVTADEIDCGSIA